MSTSARNTDINKELVEAINQLKTEKNAVILAHYYQVPEIQEIADFVGDSLELSRKAASTNADIILFAGVHFMAETAKIINPGKKVLLPDMEAGCSLADSCTPDAFAAMRKKHPNHVAVTYINCSAEIKAMSDYVCTSSNAEAVINSIPSHLPILFAPDKNLGHYLKEKTGRKILLWDGSCIVHEAFSIEKLINLWNKHTNAELIAHPESERHILKVADFIGSTSAMINYVKKSPKETFIIATEAGIIHQMQKIMPDKKLLPAPSHEDNTCACSECPYMKLNTLQKLHDCLLNESPEIVLPEHIMARALAPIEKMLSIK